MSEAKGVDAVDRALQILGCFAPDKPDLSLADIAKATGLYKSTILRLAVSLDKFGFMLRDENGRFRLGPAIWRLGSAYRQAFDLSTILRPELEHLSNSTGETASYYIRDGNSRVCLYRSEPMRAIRHSIAEGTIMPLAQGASGKILRAFSGLEGEALPRITKNGFAISLGERDPEVAAVAVPIRATGGALLGALAISGLISRFSTDRILALLAALQETQQRLANKII